MPLSRVVHQHSSHLQLIWAFACGYPGEVDLDAAATGNPTSGPLGGGPSTNSTQKAILAIPKGKGK